mgnify:CR=1 FL=1
MASDFDIKSDSDDYYNYYKSENAYYLRVLDKTGAELSSAKLEADTSNDDFYVSQFVQNLGYLKGRLNKNCYPLMWNLIDSHDTARFLHLCNDNKKKQHLAAAFQLLLPGMPMIYYGDEYAMPGANDPDCRRGMYWDEEYQDKEMYEWYKRLIQVRKSHACIVEGELAGIVTEDEADLHNAPAKQNQADRTDEAEDKVAEVVDDGNGVTCGKGGKLRKSEAKRS